MAELSLVCPATTTTAGGGGDVNVNNRTLIRTGSTVPRDTAVSFNSPGTGWLSFGDTIAFSGSGSFVDSTQFFRNGQLVLPAESAGDNNDVYYVTNTSFAFEFPIIKNDVIQIWQFTTTSG